MLKDFFKYHLRRSDRRAMFIILLLVNGVLAVMLINRQHDTSALDILTADSTSTNISDRLPAPMSFDPNTADSLTLRAAGLSPRVTRNLIAYRTAGGHFRRPEDLARLYGMTDSMMNEVMPYLRFPAVPRTSDSRPPKGTSLPSPVPFDPNTADSLTLRAAGLNARVTRNLIAYRTAGGHFRRPEDLARLYGMTNEMLTQVKPYLRFSDMPRDTLTDVSKAKLPDDSLYTAPRPAKLHDGERVDLNLADSSDLVRIPGIGPYYARRILSYRQRLGGFVSTAQLTDIPNLPDITPWVELAEGSQRRINLNKASLSQLKAHPYIGYYKARAIVNLREQEGRIAYLKQLSWLEEFSEDDVNRLEPYVTLE